MSTRWKDHSHHKSAAACIRKCVREPGPAQPPDTSPTEYQMSATPHFRSDRAMPPAPRVPWTFDLSNVHGLSAHALEMHLGLYATYVKEANALIEQLQEFPRGHTLSAEERLRHDGLVRRHAFEHNGVRLHESFFEALGGPGKSPSAGGVFSEAVESSFGGFEPWKADVTELANTRGVGWVVTYRCQVENRLTNVWVEDHTRGLLLDLSPIAVFDLWEHAYLLDFSASQRSGYINTVLANVNWDVIEQRCAS